MSQLSGILTCLSSLLLLVRSATNVGALQGNPDVLVVILAANEEHLLSTFFGGFEQLSYPKENIGLWIRSDHNRDDTPHLLDIWLEKSARLYHSVSVDIQMIPQEYAENPTKHSWPISRYQTLIKHKEGALSYARQQNIPYVWFLDTDAFITNRDVLQDLMAENRTVIAPLLQSMSLYSNFWGEMDKKGYYLRSKNYMEIVERELIGTHPAALVHSAVLINLENAESAKLTFRREVVGPSESRSLPIDDIIVFARSAQKASIGQFVTNKKLHGWMLASTETVNMEQQELINLKVDITHKSAQLAESDVLRSLTRKPVKDSLGVNQVYLINLHRRRDRRERMKYCFSELGIRFKYMPAVDGKEISSERKESLGIRQLPEYRDPYKHRNLTLADRLPRPNYSRFRLMETLKAIHDNGQVEFVYLGRKKLANASEPYLSGTDKLVHVDYSYWTLSYYITKRGAQKLLDGEPLSKMVPVDEYIPIMFDRHPQSGWKNAFQPRTLRAASAHPLLVYPTHYTGEENYFSDTEESPLVEELIDQSNSDIRADVMRGDSLKEEL
ncbi:glycosyltransferase 25 family member-like [Tropilaelaps mercedesae]|uniref:Glycosyltransferase 25 family member-like n=1 Tax=Tropilaelaps mercedesae TaxID=418985 RepID=A0A1V9X192_9ACAR|nr:glycosyltransferase 25 family member-like [Tropilaelaps mercedesae]